MTDIKKILACLNYLGVSSNLNYFAKRMQIQKLIYLIQIFGVDLDYKFNWYLHGPYSSPLTKILFENKNIPRDSSSLTQGETEKLSKLKEFLGEDLQSSHNLEIIVSLHFLLMVGKYHHKSDKEMIELLKEKKPFIPPEKIEKYYEKIKKLIEEK